ncbi:hypothetical protein [Pyxidicoccus caerfyrddinensis]|uniref:hypothetical protein n=1 Tax=Pyxidicoccus caerfyrddinensis TaxID=2709663 RepID=UPI0013D9FA78|nr:hypothetical protein [Pyxidicoccus caerfyrddinensis]
MTGALVVAVLAALVCAAGWWRAHRRWKASPERPDRQGTVVPEDTAPAAGELALPEQVSALEPWQVVEFEHFVGVRHANGAWTHVILKPTGETLDVEAAGKRVQLHGNGIEFLPPAPGPAAVIPVRPRGPDDSPPGGA